jgi:SAM-dependent methyltransferase
MKPHSTILSSNRSKSVSTEPDCTPFVEVNKIAAEPFIGRARLLVRWTLFSLRSIRSGYWDFATAGLRANAALMAQTLADVAAARNTVECNICGWRGRRFYPNCGPGYDERNTLCPGCRGLDRHRAMLIVLIRRSRYFESGTQVIEVAPMRRIQALCLAQPQMRYISFDLHRFAMEQGDITKMRFASNSADYFTCFHVLEHIPDEAKAISEIRRVLKPGGTAIFQVPVVWDLEKSFEYERPDPREVGHVRRYGQDFGSRISNYGFEVCAVRASELASSEEIGRFGLSDEPIFFARKPIADSNNGSS